MVFGSIAVCIGVFSIASIIIMAAYLTSELKSRMPQIIQTQQNLEAQHAPKVSAEAMAFAKQSNQEQSL